MGGEVIVTQGGIRTIRGITVFNQLFKVITLCMTKYCSHDELEPTIKLIWQPLPQSWCKVHIWGSYSNQAHFKDDWSPKHKLDAHIFPLWPKNSCDLNKWVKNCPYMGKPHSNCSGTAKANNGYCPPQKKCYYHLGGWKNLECTKNLNIQVIRM